MMNVEKFIEDLVSKKFEESKNDSISRMDHALDELAECFDIILARLKNLEDKINKDVNDANDAKKDAVRCS